MHNYETAVDGAAEIAAGEAAVATVDADWFNGSTGGGESGASKRAKGVGESRERYATMDTGGGAAGSAQ